MTSHAPLPRLLAVSLAAALAAWPVRAQVVTGTLVSDVTGRALSEGAVVLEDEAGAAVASAVLDGAGTFTLTAPSAGRYRLRLRLPGDTVASDLFGLTAGDTATLHLSVAPPRAASAPGGLLASVTGRVRDGLTAAAVADAFVTVSGTSEALTDGEGRFHVSALPPGRHEVRVERLGYTPLVDSLTVAVGGVLDVDVALFPAALPVEGLRVEVAPTTVARRERSGFSSLTLTAADVVELGAPDLQGVLRARAGPRVRIRPRGVAGSGYCLEVARAASMAAQTQRQIEQTFGRDMMRMSRPRSQGSCRQALLVLDGHPLTDSFREGVDQGQMVAQVLDLPPERIESVQVLLPVEAQGRFGLRGAYGAILVRTRNPR